ncbi:MAG: nicotinate-nucleotide adenylyltransferase [Actinomycetes bacterium]
MRIGILGGTFDPPHLAHLHTGEVAYRQLGLDMVVFMPAGAPWQKAGRQVSDAEHRWAMTRLAVEGVDYFVADEREVHRDGWTYTADTLATFDPDAELVLILGADSARGLPTWERAEEVLSRVRLAVAPRPGTDREEVEAAVPETPIEWLDMVPIDISGTLIRERVAAGRSVRFLVRDSVWRYIVAENLYTDAADVPVA